MRIKCVGVSILFLATTCLAAADCRPRVVAPPRVAVVAPAAVVVPAITLPLYSAVYDPSYELRQRVGELEKQVEVLRQQSLQKPQLPPGLQLDIDTRAANVFRSNHCGKCHTGEQAKGGLALFDPAGSLNLAVDRVLVWDQMDSGTMPKGHPAASDEDCRVIREWMLAGRKAAAPKK